MKFNEYRHWRKPKKKNKDIIPKVIDNLDRIKDSLFNSTDSIAYNNAFAIDTVIKWLSTLTNVNESLRKNTLIKCVKKLDEIYNSLNELKLKIESGLQEDYKSDMYYNKQKYVQNLMRRNAEIETLTEEQHEVLEELASFRHELHSSIDALFSGNSNIYRKIHNGDSSPINDELQEVDLPTINWSVSIEDIPDESWLDLDCEESDYDSYEEYEKARQDLYDDYYSKAYDDYQKLNDDIENYLAEIDKIHGTQYCPTGIARMRRYEDFKLMDKEEPEYQLGDAYIVDTKQELIDGLNKIIIGDTIALKQDDREITIYFNDENDYSILDDDGTIDDSLRFDDIGRIHDMTKEDVLDWIEETSKQDEESN